jgi:hypothetical protein
MNQSPSFSKMPRFSRCPKDPNAVPLSILLGTFTTVLFCGVEWAVHAACEKDAVRYPGGVIGLALGDVIKNQLDKRFVFVNRADTLLGAS